MKLTVIIQQDDDGRFNASCPELKGCHSYGNTYDDAMKTFAKQLSSILRTYLRMIDKHQAQM